MKVKDLIKKLQSLDQNAVVIVKSSNFEHNGANVAVSSVYQCDNMRKHYKIFSDAFDGVVYKKEVYIIDGDESAVFIN